MQLLCKNLVILAVLALATLAMAQRASQRSTPASAPTPGKPCCDITSINLRAGVATAKVNATGQTFQFKAPASVLNSLHVGQGIYANIHTNQVSVDGIQPAGSIVPSPPSSNVGNSGSGATAAPIPPPNTVATSASGATGTTSAPSTPSGSAPGKVMVASQYPNAGQPRPQSNLCRDAGGNAISSQGIDLLPALIGAQIVTGTAAVNTTTVTGGAGRGKTPSQPPGTYVRFTLENCGDTASQTAFVTDVYLNGTRADTIKVANALPPRSATGIISSLANFASVGTCSTTNVRIVVDSQNVVQDSNLANNDQTAQVTPPCPDLAVTGIWRHWLDNLHTQFEIRYKISNLGNAPLLQSVPIHAWGEPTPGLPGDLPVNYHDTLNSLAPGEARKFQIHQAFLKGDSVGLTVAVDPYNTIAESNKDNNTVSGTF